MTAPARYVKKPVTIEAMQWDGTPEGATPIIDWVLANGPDDGPVARYHDDPPRLHSPACRCDGRGIVPGAGLASDGPEPCPETEPTGGSPAVIQIDTLEGTMSASAGDWIIREPFPTDDRLFYPCKPDIFDATYEPERPAQVIDSDGDMWTREPDGTYRFAAMTRTWDELNEAFGPLGRTEE